MALSARKAPELCNRLRTIGDVLECPKGSHASNLGSKRFAHTALRGDLFTPPPLGQSGTSLSVLRPCLESLRHCPKNNGERDNKQNHPLGQSRTSLSALRWGGGVIYPPPLRALSKKRFQKLSACIEGARGWP